MSGQKIPQRSRRPLPKNPTKLFQAPVIMGYTLNYQTESRYDSKGRYRCWAWVWGRCNNRVQVGAAKICVVDDFGVLQAVDEEPRQWS